MTDEVVPAYHRRVANGEVFFNAMSRETIINQCSSAADKVTLTSVSYACPSTYTRGVYKGESPYAATVARNNLGVSPSGLLLPQSGVVSLTDVNSMVTQVSTAVAAKRGAGNANLYEDIAQYKQALSTGSDIMARVRDILSRIPRRTIIGASNAYLLYRYGIAPLVNDLWQVKTALEAKYVQRRETTRASETTSGFSSRVLSLDLSGVGNNGSFLFNTSEEVTVRAMTLDQFTTSFRYEAGLSMKNLAILPWELVPLSFVADWFFNMGELLASYVPAFGFESLGGCVVVQTSTTTNVNALGVSSNSYYTAELAPGGGFAASRLMKQRMPQLARPGFVVKNDFRFDHLTRALDALALAVPVILGFKPTRSPRKAVLPGLKTIRYFGAAPHLATS